MTNKPKVISLFSGCGGMDLGFIKAGFEVIWANDMYDEAIMTYSKNIGDHIIKGDITQIKSEDIPDGADVVIGGFPCQGFSIANTRRHTEDERNFLYKEMLRVIRDKKPKFFVAENVKGILSLAGGRVFEMIKQDFQELGYTVEARVLNAAEYGVPQCRERVIIMGNRLGIENPFPVKTHYVPSNTNSKAQLQLVQMKDESENKLPAKTVVDTIGYLSDVRLSHEPIQLENEIVYNHIASTNVSDKFWARKYPVNQEDICDYLKEWRDKSGWTTKKVDDHFGYKYTAGHWFRKDNKSGSIPSPEDWWELKKILGFDDKYDKQVTTLVEKEIKFEQSLRITNWDRPSDTITATGPEIHVNKKRRLSVRECAKIQSFPDDYIFYGSLNKMYLQIGNAVPVELARVIATQIIKYL